MTREWADAVGRPNRRRVSLRPIRPGGDGGSRLPGILEGFESRLGETLVRTLAAGNGLLFTTTREGGAIGVHLYQGETRASTYVASPEELEEALEAINGLVDKQKGPRPLTRP